MELKQVVEVPVEHFYDVLINSAVHDIERYAGKKISPAELNGFSYVKTYENGSSASILITDQNLHSVYGFQTSTRQRTYDSKYQLESLEGNKSCQIIYTEELTSEGKLQQLNDRIMSILLQRTKKKRMKALFQAIENDYQQNERQS